eukprot:Platyproteum_vivax@DN14126_c0_g1_i1.p1
MQRDFNKDMYGLFVPAVEMMAKGPETLMEQVKNLSLKDMISTCVEYTFQTWEFRKISFYAVDPITKLGFCVTVEGNDSLAGAFVLNCLASTNQVVPPQLAFTEKKLTDFDRKADIVLTKDQAIDVSTFAKSVFRRILEWAPNYPERYIPPIGNSRAVIFRPMYSALI